jgi:hypothetical protein
MGLDSDFFLANPAQFEGTDLSHGPDQSLGTLQWKGVDTIKLLCLEEWITETDPGDIEQDIVRQGEEWLVVKLSSRLTTALAALTPEARNQFAREWLLSDDDAELLHRLTSLARAGQATGRDVYVWMSA